jgi:hypothetical protein
MLSIQSPRSVVMVRPHHFSPNADTAQDNSFQANWANRPYPAFLVFQSAI